MIELRISEPDPIVLEAEDQDQASLAVLEAFVSGGDIPAYTGSYNVTPTQSQQTLETNGKKMVRDVKVAPIPSQYIIPEGTLEVTQNGQQSVREYENVNVNVPAPTGEKTINVTQNGTTTEDVANYATAKVVTNVPASAVDSGTKNIGSNGTHNVVGYASAEVNVPNSYSASDEGKVVQSGALVSQSSQTINENGTYDTTLKNEVVVDVQGGGGGGGTVIASGTIAGNGGYGISVPVGTKMPETDFAFVIHLPKNQEITYVDDSNNQILLWIEYVVLKKTQRFDLSSVANNIKSTNTLGLTVNNDGTIKNLNPNGTAAIRVSSRANGYVFAMAGNESSQTISRTATGFKVTVSSAAWMMVFRTGYTYEWEIIYFGDDPTNDIVEIS